MATLKDVAKEVGVSIATVSYVLNDTGTVSKDVSNKVRAAVKKLGYRPNKKAQAMKTGVSNSIGLILPDLTNPFFPELAQKIEIMARKKGFTVILFNTLNKDDLEEEGFNILEQHGVDGIIWCPASNTTPKYLKTISSPIVVVDRPIKGFDTVQSDYKQGGALLSEYVNNSGHKNIALISGLQNIESAKQRRLGFIENLSSDIKIDWEIEEAFSMELSDSAKEKLEENKATLIVCADDVIAIGAINTLDNFGVKVPLDVSVLGFDNIPWSKVVRPQLTTINQPIASISREAVNLLVNKIQEPDPTVKTIVLGVDLIERDSSIGYES